MSALIKRFNYFKANATTAVEIKDVNSCKISLGLDIKNNKLTIELKNDPVGVFSDGTIRHRWVDIDGTSTFKVIKTSQVAIINEEIIDVYATYTDTTPGLTIVSDNYFLFSGILITAEAKGSESEHTLTIEGLDRNYIILNKLTNPQAFTLIQNLTSPLLIQRFIRAASSPVSGNVRSFDASGNVVTGVGYFIDARLFSEGIKESGTPTSISSKKLIDIAATFMTNGVLRDHWVRNTVTNEYAFVISVDSEFQLTLAKDIFTSANAYQVSDGFIQDTRINGTAFPSVVFSHNDQPTVQSVQQTSQTDYTNDKSELDPQTGSLTVKRAARYYVDRKNRFHWFIPEYTPDFYMKIGATGVVGLDSNVHKIINHSLKNQVVGDVNLIIYKAGTDMNNSQIKGFYRAKFTGAPITKDAKRIWEHIARGIKQAELRAGNITYSKADEYNYPASYPMTPTWTTTPVNSDAEYNTSFKSEANDKAVALCKEIFNRQAHPRWKGPINIRGEDIRIGALIQFTDSRFGINKILIRATGIVNDFTTDGGWITRLECEEDNLDYQVA